MEKQYGLILPGKKSKPNPTFQATRNVFGEESDSEEDTRKIRPMLRASEKIRKKDKQVQEKAIIEDPTVFQYDELYDEMKNKKNAERSVAKMEKKPKYIEKLLESANKRKRENERRVERQVQKEREKEGDEFADKESFVTTAYKQKLEELRAEEEREKREEYLENIGDVTKQKDLGGFYRHLYEQKLGKVDKSKDSKVDEKELKESVDKSTAKEEKKKESQESPSTTPPRKPRNYRKRKVSNELLDRDLSDGEILSEEERNLTLSDIKASKKSKQNDKNIDADSDFATESSDSEDDRNKSKKDKAKNKISNKEGFNSPETPELQSSSKSENIQQSQNPKSGTNESGQEKSDAKNKEISQIQSEKSADNKENVEKTPPKPKINIWEKRTVGIVFEEALKRYYERKAARSR